MIRPLRILKAIIEYPLGSGRVNRLSPYRAKPVSRLGASRFDPARKMAQRGHEKRRAHIRSVARQLCRETNQPIPPALRG